jgi:hypothetical protein
MEVAVVLLFVGIAAAGALIGRWWTLVLPLVVWPIWFLGLAQDWWGYGMGDGWEYGAALIILVSLASVGIALALRPFARSALGRRRERPAH